MLLKYPFIFLVLIVMFLFAWPALPFTPPFCHSPQNQTLWRIKQLYDLYQDEGDSQHWSVSRRNCKMEFLIFKVICNTVCMSDSIWCMDMWGGYNPGEIAPKAVGGRYEEITFNCIFNWLCRKVNLGYVVKLYEIQKYYTNMLLGLFYGTIRIT